MNEKSKWLSYSFSRGEILNETNFEGFENLWFERPRVVFERGNPGSWDEFGVRDPALLVDVRGNLFRGDGAIVMYYTGSHDNGRSQGIGRAVSFDEGRSWLRSPGEPVLAPQGGAWDSIITSTPWVLRRDDGIYRLYYRGAQGVQEEEAIGLAVSTDGIHFERVNSKPILTRYDFKDLANDTLMGCTNVVRRLDGLYLLTFEGTSQHYRGALQIFGAISEDGEHFSPLNNGCPIFTCDHVRSWRVRGVANPRITVLEDKGIHMLAFNAHYKYCLYAIGLAFTRDFKKWWEHPGNPIILPSGSPLDDPFSGRIEGGVIVKEDLTKRNGPVRMFLMGIPRRGPSHKGGVVGLAQGWFNNPHSRYAFRAVNAKPEEIEVLTYQDGTPETLSLKQSATSTFPPRVHFHTFSQGDLNGVSFEFFLESVQRGSALVTIGEEIDTSILDAGDINLQFGQYIRLHGEEVNISSLYTDGIRLQFNKAGLYIYNPSFRASLYERLRYGRAGRILNKLSLRNKLKPSGLRFPWKRLAPCEQGVWKRLSLEKNDGNWVVRLDGKPEGSLPETYLRGGSQIYDISIQSCLQPIRIRNLKVLVNNG